MGSLSKNYINTVDTWAKLEEIILYSNSKASDYKKDILSHHFSVTAPKMVGMKYNSDTCFWIIRNIMFIV